MIAGVMRKIAGVMRDEEKKPRLGRYPMGPTKTHTKTNTKTKTKTFKKKVFPNI